MRLLYFLPILAMGWVPAASGDAGAAADFSEYVYLHLTRGEGAPPAQSCRGRVQPTR